MADKVKTVTEKRNKGGRPPLPADQVRDQRIVVYMNSQEKQKLAEWCERSGRSSGDLIRATISRKPLRARAVPEINREVYAELGRIGSNLNQVAKLMNRYGMTELDQEDYAILAELIELLHDTRIKLVGELW